MCRWEGTCTTAEWHMHMHMPNTMLELAHWTDHWSVAPAPPLHVSPLRCGSTSTAVASSAAQQGLRHASRPDQPGPAGPAAPAVLCTGRALPVGRQRCLSLPPGKPPLLGVLSHAAGRRLGGAASHDAQPASQQRGGPGAHHPRQHGAALVGAHHWEQHCVKFGGPAGRAVAVGARGKRADCRPLRPRPQAPVATRAPPLKHLNPGLPMVHPTTLACHPFRPPGDCLTLPALPTALTRQVAQRSSHEAGVQCLSPRLAQPPAVGQLLRRKEGAQGQG